MQSASEPPILHVEHISHAFGGVQAVQDCTFSVPAGSISGLIGPNGAGKTTAINVVGGALKLQHGQVRYSGMDTSGWSPAQMARQGLLRTFQLSREFARLTVLENVLVAATGQIDETLWGALFRRRAIKARERTLVDQARQILSNFGLDALRNDWAETLSGGQKRLLELARAVMARPKLLLLDEPMAGVNPALIDRIEGHIRELRDQGLTLLLVEHNLNVVERLCDLVIVMAEGRTLAEGTLADHRANPEVVRAYLGSSGTVGGARV
ncbi:MAG TPA: ABC transporter ATP-binding protein [Chloroflexota bacterium]|jgi:ABC-type branched-subunit amino acid transport system ATPase component